ncbi:archaeosine tRNA-ribosyltransferase, partial [mine drainage metagenome]
MGEKCEPKEISDDHGKLDYLESENFIVVSTLSPKRFSPRILLRIITRIRKNLGYQKLLYIPGISDPYLIPALFYIGVDVFDNITAKLEGSMGTKYTIFGRSNGIPDYSNENSEFVKEELDILRSSCENGMLTEVVEKYCISHKSNEILRILKQDYY